MPLKSETTITSPVVWGCRILQLLLCRWVRTPTNEFSGYDTKQSDGNVPVLLELGGMQSTPLLQSAPGTYWPGVEHLVKS